MLCAGTFFNITAHHGNTKAQKVELDISAVNKEYLSKRAVTTEGLVKLGLAENHAKVMDGAGVKLHPEHHVSGRVPVPLVVTLQL